MSELFMAVLADLEFAEGDEVKIEYSILFFVFHQLSKKLRYLREIIRSSGYLQHFIVEALDTETKSHSRKLLIFSLYNIDEIYYFVHRIRIQFYAELCDIFKIKFGSEAVDDFDDSLDTDPARSSSSEI